MLQGLCMIAVRRLAVETAPGWPAGREVRLRGLEADGDGTSAISDADNSQALLHAGVLDYRLGWRVCQSVTR